MPPSHSGAGWRIDPNRLKCEDRAASTSQNEMRQLLESVPSEGQFQVQRLVQRRFFATPGQCSSRRLLAD